MVANVNSPTWMDRNAISLCVRVHLHVTEEAGVWGILCTSVSAVHQQNTSQLNHTRLCGLNEQDSRLRWPCLCRCATFPAPCMCVSSRVGCLFASYGAAAVALDQETNGGVRRFEVCDNIDLEMVLMEYESYHYVKFQKYPKLIRRTAEPGSVRRIIGMHSLNLCCI